MSSTDSPCPVRPASIKRGMPTIDETIAFIQKAHAGQVDKAGEAYWKHPYAVMKRLPENVDVEVKLAALLHDVLEDTSYTRTDLLQMGYSERTVSTVEAVTKKKGDVRPYAEKIKALVETGGDDAILVKFADMSENLSASRLDKLDPAMRDKMLKKYVEPYKLLVKAVTDMKPRLPSSRSKPLPAGKFPQNTL